MLYRVLKPQESVLPGRFPAEENYMPWVPRYTCTSSYQAYSEKSQCKVQRHAELQKVLVEKYIHQKRSIVVIRPEWTIYQSWTECKIRPKWTKRIFVFEFLSEHLTERTDGFDRLMTLIEQSDESGWVSFD